jgi:predicted TIM-barrel fold metal-dependent hydrolase
MPERIISADSHMLVTDERVMAHLSSAHHEAFRQIQGPPADTTADPGSGAAGVRLPAAGRAGEWDPVERLKDMDLDGVDAEVLYTDTAAGSRYYSLPPDDCLAVFKALNTAALEFASVDPKRLLPVYLLPLHDIDAAIAEAERVVGEGGRAVQIPLYPTAAKLKPYYDPSYDPLWSALEACQLPVSLHVVPPTGVGLGRDPTPARGIFQSVPPIFMALPMTELIVSGVFTRHPGLRVIMVESGLAWIPFMLDRLDRVYHKSRWQDRGMPLDELPSHYWYQNMGATFEEDELGLELRHHIGVDNMFWATDYPHPDSTWPESQRVVNEQFATCDEQERNKMICDNAARVYQL